MIAIPVLIVTMLAGPSKFKALAHCKYHLPIARINLNHYIAIITTLSSSIVVLLCCFFVFVFSIGITCIIHSYLFPCLDCGIAMVLWTLQ